MTTRFYYTLLASFVLISLNLSAITVEEIQKNYYKARGGEKELFKVKTFELEGSINIVTKGTNSGEDRKSVV